MFDRLLAQPNLRHKVVTVHSRGAESAVVERLRAAGVVAILHWYTGPARLIAEALNAGLYFSINPAMLRTEKGKALIAALPHDRALTESDGPFAKAHGHQAAPADMTTLASELARTWGMQPDEACDQIYGNMARLYAATVGTDPRHSAPTV